MWNNRNKHFELFTKIVIWNWDGNIFKALLHEFFTIFDETEEELDLKCDKNKSIKEEISVHELDLKNFNFFMEKIQGEDTSNFEKFLQLPKILKLKCLGPGKIPKIDKLRSKCNKTLPTWSLSKKRRSQKINFKSICHVKMATALFFFLMQLFELFIKKNCIFSLVRIIRHARAHWKWKIFILMQFHEAQSYWISIPCDFWS